MQVLCTTRQHRVTAHGGFSSVFLLVLDSDIADIPTLPQESLPDNLRLLTLQEPLSETSIERLVQSIQEVLHGELKVCTAVLMNYPIYSL